MSAVSGQEDAWLNGYRILPQKINMVEEIMTSEYNIKSALWESPAGGHGGDIYRNSVDCDFSINLNPLGMPDAVREALKKSMERWERYPDPLCQQLTEAIAQKYQIRAETILCGNGAADLIFQAVLAERPRRALVLSPSFSEYEQALRAFDCQICVFPLKPEDGFVPDMDRLTEAVADVSGKKVDMVFFCNPNNPSGIAVKREQVEKLAAFCLRHQVRLILDECFCEFLESPWQITMMGLTEDYPNLVILRAFTKTYSMAGLRLGFAVCSDERLLKTMAALRQPWSVSLPAQEAGVAALSVPETYLEKTRRLLREERPFLKKGLEELGYRVFDSMANFLLFYDPQEDAHSLWELCRHQKILIRDCRNFSGLGPGYYRICIRSREENSRLLRALGELEKYGQMG